VFEASIEYLESADLDTICMSQGGDWFGGETAHIANGGSVGTKRKAMNSFICKSYDQFDFRGSINEDVNTYTRAQQYGKLFLTHNIVSLEQERTQSNEGGLTDLYESEGTYIKSFYTILYAPSATKLSKMGEETNRIHHRISWNNAAPKIVPESTKN